MDNDLVVTENAAATGAKSGTVQQMMMQLLAMMLQPMPIVELLW
jgi:CRISPR/Cas system-associated endoribonuclease Cas2